MRSLHADGLLLEGHTLYAVRNQVNVAVIELTPDLGSGTVVDQLTGNLDVPTTVARFGSSLYVVNARFGTTDQPPRSRTGSRDWIGRCRRQSVRLAP